MKNPLMIKNPIFDNTEYLANVDNQVLLNQFGYVNMRIYTFDSVIEDGFHFLRLNLKN